MTGFEQVIGQQEAQQRLLQLVDEQRLPHAIMLCGPMGCGKMALAMAFAAHLLRRNANDAAMLAKWEHPDLHFTFPTIKLPSMSADHKPVSDDFIRQWHDMIKGGPYFTMTEWMEHMGAANQQAIITAGESDALSHKLSLKSSQGGYKVSLIWLPERMNIECANKILKLLEEPPQQTVFLLVCEAPDRLLETIRSRVQRIDVKRIANKDITDALIEQRGLMTDKAERVAHMAGGSWLKALEALKADSENEFFLDMFQTLMRMAYARRVKDMKTWSERMATAGREKQKRFLEYALRLVRENFMYNFGERDLCYMTEREEDFAKKFARYINEANVIEISDLITLAIRDIGQNANAKIVFFHLAIQMIVLLIQK